MQPARRETRTLRQVLAIQALAIQAPTIPAAQSLCLRATRSAWAISTKSRTNGSPVRRRCARCRLGPKATARQRTQRPHSAPAVRSAALRSIGARTARFATTQTPAPVSHGWSARAPGTTRRHFALTRRSRSPPAACRRAVRRSMTRRCAVARALPTQVAVALVGLALDRAAPPLAKVQRTLRPAASICSRTLANPAALQSPPIALASPTAIQATNAPLPRMPSARVRVDPRCGTARVSSTSRASAPRNRGLMIHSQKGCVPCKPFRKASRPAPGPSW